MLKSYQVSMLKQILSLNFHYLFIQFLFFIITLIIFVNIINFILIC